jgi:hypothetical protein
MPSVRVRIQLRRRELELKECAVMKDDLEMKTLAAVGNLANAWNNVYSGRSTYGAVVEAEAALSDMVQRVAMEMREPTK